MPERSFPAVAIQGDSLSIMLTTSRELMAKGKQLQDEEIFYSGMELAKSLRDHLVHYEELLEKEGFEKPYSISARQLQIVDGLEENGMERLFFNPFVPLFPLFVVASRMVFS